MICGQFLGGILSEIEVFGHFGIFKFTRGGKLVVKILIKNFN